MALYLGNKHISEFYLGDKKIKEAYIGNKKVYPENSSSDELMFKIIFTDSDGNTYDQLAFRNINTQQVLSLNFRSTDLLNLKDDKFTNFGTINNNTISLNRQEFYQSINSDSGQYLIYIDENNNKLISVSYDATRLKELISGNVIYETEIDIKDIYSDGYGVYWEWEGFNINSGYELVGCKNKTSEIITICNDGDENKVSLNKSTIQNNIVKLYINFDETTTPESEFYILMEPSLSFTNSFTTPNGLTLKYGTNYVVTKMSQLEYDNYLNEDGFYPLTFGIDNLDSEFYHGMTVAVFQDRTEDGSSVAIPNGKVTIYDTADYNFITGRYSDPPYGDYQIYELELNNNVTDNEKASLYAGHSIGRVGMVDSKGKEYKFEFRLPNKTNEPEFTDGYFRYKFRFQDSDEFIGFANENSGIYHTTPVIGLATSASELTSSSIYKNNTVLCMNTGTFVNNSSSSASGNTDIIEDQWFRTTQVIDPQSWIDQGFSWIGFLVYGTTYPFAFVMPLDFITKATENEVYEFSSSEISQIKSVTLDYRASLAHGLQWNSSSINYLFYPTGNTTLNPRVQAVSFDKLNNTLTFILRSW